jgi:hypothetical protein
MKQVVITLLILLCVALAVTDASAQRTAIRVEAMDIHRLAEMGLPNPNGWDNVSSGLTSVGTGTVVWLSGWDITGDTTWKPAASYLWEMTSRPGGSSSVLDSTVRQWTTFRPDVAGTYVIRLTAGGKDTSLTVIASNFTGTNRHNLSGAAMNCATCHSSGTAFTSWKESKHAKMFENAMNGLKGSYWGVNCFKCHTVGYNLSAANNGFDNVASQLGFVPSQWTPWRPGLYDSLLTTDKKMLSMFAGIGCENCHGPYNTSHFGVGTQPKTMNSNVCAPCHNEPWRHNRYVQYEVSGHAEAIWSTSFRSTGANPVSAYNLNACVRCHDGKAFVHFTRGIPFDNRVSSGYSQITHNKIACQTCHDPHEGGLRQTPAGSDTLASGFSYAGINLGSGETCFNCHKYRRNGATYPDATSMSTHWGPHYAGTGDVYLGKNAYTFGQTIPSSIAHQMVENSCVGCHMSATPDTGTVARDKIGMHTWKMHYEPTPGTRIDNVTGCVGCHTGITSFEQIIAAFDYDGDGTVEPFVHEVEGLKNRVAMALPPVGSLDIDRNMIAASPDSVNLKRAFYNYLYVKYDGSHGVHNPKWVVGLLQTTLSSVTGVEFPPNEGIPQEFALEQNYPNPFNPATTIKFSIPEAGQVRLEVFDMVGRLVRTIAEGTMAPGNYEFTWDGTDHDGAAVASGVYLYRLNANSYSSTKKMVLMK